MLRTGFLQSVGEMFLDGGSSQGPTNHYTLGSTFAHSTLSQVGFVYSFHQERQLCLSCARHWVTGLGSKDELGKK